MTIKEYWNFIDREPFLAITWEPDFSQACSFCRMLMNHKNFHFPQIPDKTNDVIFLKSSKTLFLGHFWPFLVIFCPMGIFSKKSDSVTNNYIWTPNTIVSFRKNWTNPEKTYEQTEGRTDGPYFTGLFRPTPGVQKVMRWNILSSCTGNIQKFCFT